MAGPQAEDRAPTVARESLTALRHGDRTTARRLAFRVLEMDPRNETGWLILAALADPSGRRGYLTHVLMIHPESRRALQALDELESSPLPASPFLPTQPTQPHLPAPPAGPEPARQGPPEAPQSDDYTDRA
ncbi:MAG: hypothetical protein WBZ24_02490, partial [Anaerolineales bacterium]